MITISQVQFAWGVAVVLVTLIFRAGLTWGKSTASNASLSAQLSEMRCALEKLTAKLDDSLGPLRDRITTMEVKFGKVFSEEKGKC